MARFSTAGACGNVTGRRRSFDRKLCRRAAGGSLRDDKTLLPDVGVSYRDKVGAG